MPQQIEGSVPKRDPQSEGLVAVSVEPQAGETAEDTFEGPHILPLHTERFREFDEAFTDEARRKLQEKARRIR